MGWRVLLAHSAFGTSPSCVSGSPTTGCSNSSSVTDCITTSSSMTTSSNWCYTVDWLSSTSQFSASSVGFAFMMSSHVGAWLLAVSSSWPAAWTSAQVGPIFVVGVEHHEGPTPPFYPIHLRSRLPSCWYRSRHLPVCISGFRWMAASPR